MKLQSTKLLGTASVLALLASSAATPANAAASNGLYFGGSTLASEAFRQIFDCYTGATVGASGWTDGFTFSSSFNANTPTPGLLPNTCTIVTSVQGMYAGVGSGNGLRGYISNKPSQWYGGTVTPPATFSLTSTSQQPLFPSAQPPYVDTLNTTFGSYPYPRVDVGLGDSPLPATLAAMTTSSITFTPTTNWNSLPATVTASGSTNVSYNTSSWGQPLQLPAFEVPVAIPVNLSFTPNSQVKSGGNIVAGGAIQLSGAQLCAIFSGLVTDWSSSTSIPTLDSTGTLVSQPFYYTNVGNGIGTAAQYTTTSAPIKVVYRSDGSGTSFILTNYLKAVCPLIDKNGTAKYATIFGAPTLPSTSFSNLIANINNTTITNNWVGATGSGGVQSGVANTSNSIGYVSGDFVKPFAIASNAPNSASVQNEYQRIHGTYIPATTTTTSPTFIAPTPAAVNTAWGDAALTPPSTTSTWAAYNVYGINYPATEPSTNHGGLSVGGLSVLPLTNGNGAYPLSGTTFLYLYSCYGNNTNGQNLINFLNWFYQNPTANQAPAILRNNSFSALTSAWQTRIKNGVLTAGSGVAIALASGGSKDGCTGVTGGANP